MPGRRLLHFTVGSRRFALQVSEIMEICEIAGTTSVPGAPAAVAGVVDIRGRIVTLIDLAEIHALPRGSGGSLLAVQLAEPFAHLGILIDGRVETLESDPGDEEAQEPFDPSMPGGSFGTDDPPGLGREILLSGARPALRLDVRALAAYCTDRVRQRFRIAS